MKKLTSLLLILTFLFCACQKAPKEIEYTIYAEGSWDASSSTSSSGKVKENVTIESAREKDFSFAASTEITNDKAPKKKSFTIDGKKLELTLFKSCSTPISQSEIGKSKGIGLYDRYEGKNSSGDRIDVEFRSSNNKLLFYCLYGDSRRTEEGNFTAEQAKAKADALIKELYGEKVFAQYTHEKTFDDTTDDEIGIFYVRYIHGYKTDETILIHINRQGELISINALKLNLFSSAAKDISKADIEAAEKALRDSVSDNWEFYDDSKSIVMDSTGQYFFKIYGGIKNDKDSFGAFYININLNDRFF